MALYCKNHFSAAGGSPRVRHRYPRAIPPGSVYNPAPMSRPWQYTRSRYFLMQAVMWLILGATVGLAALISRHRGGRVESLTEKVEVKAPAGQVSVLLPKGWVIETRKPKLGQADALKIIAREPAEEADPDQPGRVVTVTLEPVTEDFTATQYLAETRKLPLLQVRQTLLGNRKWILTGGPTIAHVMDEDVPGYRLDACTIFGSGAVAMALDIELTGYLRQDPKDEDLLKQIATRVQVKE